MSAAAWDQVVQVRRTVPAFVLPQPDCIGIDAALVEAPAWGRLRQLAAAARLSAQREEWAALAHSSADHLPQPGAHGIDLDAIDCLTAPDPHDAYFRIARTAEVGTTAYLRGVVQALGLFLSEAQTTEDLRDYACIGDALVELCDTALALPQRPADDSPLPAAVRRAPTMHMRAGDPVRRWVRGHQVFAALTQGLIQTLRDFQRRSAAGDQASLGPAMQQVARLYRASAAAFRFSADFCPTVYADIIRPSMCEPFVPKGFSGSLSSDHGVLVRLLADLREPLAAARLVFPAAYEDMRAALVEIYDDHIWVCSRFSGDTSPSLRTRAVEGEHTAVDMLDRFKTRRVSMLN